MGDIIRRCEDCGAALPEGSGNRRRYCDACRKLRRKETNRAYQLNLKVGKSAMPPVVRYCTVCGKALPVESSANRKYCIPCGEKIHLEAERERARRLQKAKPKIKKLAPPPKSALEEKLPRGEHRKVDKPCKECGTMMYGVDPGTQPGIIKPKEKPKTNHDMIVDDNAAAAAKGMSYGKFKEWQRRQKELKERGEIY